VICSLTQGVGLCAIKRIIYCDEKINVKAMMNIEPTFSLPFLNQLKIWRTNYKIDTLLSHTDLETRYLGE